MTTPRDDCSGYDSFWTVVETTGGGTHAPDPADAYAAFAAAAEGA